MNMRRILSQFRESNYYLLELFIFLRITGQWSSQIAQNFLLQDKLCLITYNQSATFCQNIEEEQSTDALESIKNHVLADSAQYANYIYMLQCVSMFAWSLFVGSFLDKFAGGSMILLVNCILGDMIFIGMYFFSIHFYSLAPTYLLMTASTYIFTGGLTSFLTAMYQYTISRSDERSRSFRFMLLDVTMVLGMSSGTYIGGLLLEVIPHPGPQIRTYYWNFLFNFGMNIALLGLLGLIHFVDRRRLRKGKARESSAEEVGNEEAQSGEVVEVAEAESEVDGAATAPRSNPSAVRLFFTTLLDFDNIRSTFSSLFRRRPGNTRFHLYVLFTILFLQIFVYFGMDIALLPFAEKVYFWTSEQYSTYSSVAKIVSTILMGLGTTLLVKVFHVEDNPLMIFSHVTSFMAYALTGTFLNPWSYFIAVPIGAFNNFAIISIRAIVSKLVEGDEVGKIFAVVASLESAIPIFASPAYSNLFAATIATFPGAIYQFSAAIMVLSVVVAIFQDLYFCRTFR